MFKDSKKPRSQQGGLSQQNMIAHGTVFEGDLKSEGDFRIEGTIKGTLITKGKVVIGNTGLIEGSLNCNNADVEGQIKGKLVVSWTNYSIHCDSRTRYKNKVGYRNHPC